MDQTLSLLESSMNNFKDGWRKGLVWFL